MDVHRPSRPLPHDVGSTGRRGPGRGRRRQRRQWPVRGAGPGRRLPSFARSTPFLPSVPTPLAILGGILRTVHLSIRGGRRAPPPQESLPSCAWSYCGCGGGWVLGPAAPHLPPWLHCSPCGIPLLQGRDHAPGPTLTSRLVPSPTPYPKPFRVGTCLILSGLCALVWSPHPTRPGDAPHLSGTGLRHQPPVCGLEGTLGLPKAQSWYRAGVGWPGVPSFHSVCTALLLLL